LNKRVKRTQAKIKEQQDGDDPEAAIKAGEESLGVMSDALGTLMQVMLRNTDPAHDTLREQAATSDSGAKPTPLDQQLQALQDADQAPSPAPVPAHP
nr:hypothetical protein [Planctomycetota bacterium]